MYWATLYNNTVPQKSNKIDMFKSLDRNERWYQQVLVDIGVAGLMRRCWLSEEEETSRVKDMEATKHLRKVVYAKICERGKRVDLEQP